MLGSQSGEQEKRVDSQVASPPTIPSSSNVFLTEELGMNYIVFPGNVGSNESLSQVAEKLGVQKKQNNQAVGEATVPLSSAEIAHLREENRTFQILCSSKTSRSEPIAIAAFNVYNLEGAKAVMDAAQELQSSVILQVTDWAQPLSLLVDLTMIP
jgi:hypothetical protein